MVQREKPKRGESNTLPFSLSVKGAYLRQICGILFKFVQFFTDISDNFVWSNIASESSHFDIALFIIVDKKWVWIYFMLINNGDTYIINVLQ